MRHKTIVIIGNVGTGKSTWCEALAREMGAELVPADKFFELNPFFPLAVEDRERWSLTSDLWFLKERVKMARESVGLVEKADMVVDSGVYMSLVYAHSRLRSGFFSQDEWELYLSYYRELTRGLKLADTVVYLKAPVKVLRERIVKRGREFEIKGHSVEYLESLEKSLEVMVGQIREEKVRVVEVDTVRVNVEEDKKAVNEVLVELGGKSE